MMTSVEDERHAPRSAAYHQATRLVMETLKKMDKREYLLRYISQAMDTLYELGYNQGKRK